MNLADWGYEAPAEPEVFEYVKPKAKNMFMIMNSAIDKKMTPTLAEKKSISEYLFHQVLSNDPNTIELAVMLTTHNIPVEKQYDMIRMLLPKAYIPYPSKKKTKEDIAVERISEYYHCNIKVARRYHSLMTAKDIDRIVSKFNEGKVK